jgi:ferredoxin
VTTSTIALGIAILAVVGLIIGVASLSLLSGVLDFFFGRPKLIFLKTKKGNNGFAFAFDFNDSKDPCRFDRFKIRFFNPFGKPTQIEMVEKFGPYSSSFEEDIDMGPALKKLNEATGIDQATVQIEIYSTQDGITHQFEMSARKYFNKVQMASKTVAEAASSTGSSDEMTYSTNLPKSMIEDVVPGKGPALKLATNPQFADLFGSPVPGMAAAGAGGSATASGGTQADFIVSKVWIAPGCIVCNACEDIYPEVFDVQAATCVIRPPAMTAGSELLKFGLRIQEAAEACPVEVIKFDRA